MKNIHTITDSMLLVATLAGCYHFTPPEPHEKFNSYSEPEQDWRENTQEMDIPTNNPGDQLQPGDLGYYRD